MSEFNDGSPDGLYRCGYMNDGNSHVLSIEDLLHYGYEALSEGDCRFQGQVDYDTYSSQEIAEMLSNGYIFVPGTSSMTIYRRN